MTTSSIPLRFAPTHSSASPGSFTATGWAGSRSRTPREPGWPTTTSVYFHVPDIIRYYLSEEPILPNVETHLCRNPDDLEYTLDNLDRLVVKMVGESGGYGMLVGPHATAQERADYAKQIRANPANFVSQPTLDLSCAPCLAEEGAAPRHVDLRPFILCGRETRLVPGAFSRVALRPGSLVVNSSQGGGGKDLWVLAE